MHAVNVLYLLGMCNALTHALTIPNINHVALSKRDSWPAESLITPDKLKRAPPPPATRPKQPVVQPAKPPAAPAPVDKPISWPYVKVPYITTAFDTCGIFVDCEDSTVDRESEEIVARSITVGPSPVTLDAPQPSHPHDRRDIRTYKVKLAGISIKNLDYPGASELYSPPKGANAKVNVLDFNSDQVADFKVKSMKTKPASYDGYVTEHIVELQTIMKFMNAVIKKDSKTKAFFANWWNKELDPTTVTARPNKPSITMGDQTTINNLVFEALGSNNNRDDFVLCEEEINGYKARIWNQANAMAPAKYKKAVTDGVAGALDSNVFLSALRNVLAVFEYMNNADVKSRFQASIKNVGIELKNVEHLTKEKTDLSKEWQDFMKAHMADVEKKAKDWLSDRIVKDTESQINDMIKELQTLHKNLIAKETGKDKAANEKKAKAESDKLDAEIKTAEAAVEAQEKVVKTREAELKVARDAATKKNAEFRKINDDLNAIVKQIAKEKDAKKKADLTKTKDTLEKDKTRLETEKAKTDADKKAAETKRNAAKEEKLNKQRAVGLKRRKRWSLRSKELKDVIDNLEKDKKVVAAFKTAGASMRMPSEV